jgi:hypothetical protein
VFEYIEMFYNPKRKPTNNGMLSPPLVDCFAIKCRAVVEFEIRQRKLNEAGVWETRGPQVDRSRVLPAEPSSSNELASADAD